MEYIPHDYQQYAARKIIDNPACGLFLNMGMGKSVIALTAISELMHDRFEVRRVLVIAPLRVAQDTWPKECKKWDHLRYLKISKILGPESQRIRAVNTPADIYIINRENTQWIVDLYGRSWPYDMVVIDELSSFKSARSKRFRALRKVRPLIKRIVGLTGTPAPNGLIDLWSQMYLLDRGQRLGKTLGGYRARYFVPDKRSYNVIFSYKPRPEAEKAIYGKISDIVLSMKSCDYIKMPDKMDNFVEVEMSEEEYGLYKKLERDALLMLDDHETDTIDNTTNHTLPGDVDAVNAGVLSNKLLQMANGAVYDENGKVRHIHDRKLEALEDLYEGANGKPILIFYTYRHDRDRLYEFFRRLKVQPREIDKPRDISDWNEGNIEVAIAHPASAGHGLNLQAGGSTIIWFGLTWSLELYQQANARLYRQGQNETVIVHHILTAGTIDEDVIAALTSKELGQAALIEAVKARLASVNQIKGVEKIASIEKLKSWIGSTDKTTSITENDRLKTLHKG